MIIVTSCKYSPRRRRLEDDCMISSLAWRARHLKSSTFCSFASSILRKPNRNFRRCMRRRQGRMKEDQLRLRGKTEPREVTTRRCMICRYENLRICGISHTAAWISWIHGRRTFPRIYHVEVARTRFSKVAFRKYRSQPCHLFLKQLVISVLSLGFKIPLRGGHDSSHSQPRCSARSYLQSVYLMVLIFSCNLLRGSQIHPSLSPSPLGALLLLFRGEVYNASPLLSSHSVKVAR